MPIDFTSDIEFSKLVELISWYMQNSCTITRQPIHTTPVRVIVEKPQERVMPEIYELSEIKKWLETSQDYSDPMSRSRVIGFEDFTNSTLHDNETDSLRKLTWFVRNFLSSVKDYVAADNIAQIKVWMRAWSSACKQQANTCNDIRIILTNGISIQEHAYASSAKKVQRHLKAKYNIVYTPTVYRDYSCFLDEVANMQDASDLECWQVFLKYFPELPTNEFANFAVEKPLSNIHTDDISDDDMLLTPLQLACYRENVPAVRALIFGGANYLNSYSAQKSTPTNLLLSDNDGLSSTDDSQSVSEPGEYHTDLEMPTKREIAAIKQHQLSPYKFSSLIITIVLGNLELFRLHRKIIEGNETLLFAAINYVIVLDEVNFLQSIRDDFGLELDISFCLGKAIEYSAVSVFKWLLSEYKSQIVRFSSTEEMMLFHAIPVKSNSRNMLTDAGELFLSSLLKIIAFPVIDIGYFTRNPL
jgi:hypothetical protein